MASEWWRVGQQGSHVCGECAESFSSARSLRCHQDDGCGMPDTSDEELVHWKTNKNYRGLSSPIGVPQVMKGEYVSS